MSRYLLLLLLNLPFIFAGILTAVTQYKLKHSSRKKMALHVVFWVSLLVCLALAEPIYNTLLRNGLTQTESLSLFDVVQITLIVILLYIVNRMRMKLEVVERRVNDFHQELSIKLSMSKTKK